MALTGCKDNKKQIVVAAELNQITHYAEAAKRTMENHKDWIIKIKEIDSVDHIDLIEQTKLITNNDIADVFVVPLHGIKTYYRNGWLADLNHNDIVEKIG